MSIRFGKQIVAVLLIAVFAVGCSTTNYSGEGAVAGAAIGGGIGYGVGRSPLAAAAGIAGGAMLGWLIGNFVEKPYGVREKNMAEIAKLHALYNSCLQNEHNRAAVARETVNYANCEKIREHARRLLSFNTLDEALVYYWANVAPLDRELTQVAEAVEAWKTATAISNQLTRGGDIRG